ncbi:hypothetical protein IWQ62_002666 [Dispira parvispora]|uniref:Uncharacterized protein n=1 Tax=Dispira parvispora TaxID=1520584 RepID=A0A9W8AW99_9FUNG|nr:hypothetical protein IWQ62_002666 [Dispira parvispora]
MGLWAKLRLKTFEHPFIMWSFAIGLASPVIGVSTLFFRKNYLGWTPSEPLPNRYPVPEGPRPTLTGYDN